MKDAPLFTWKTTIAEVLGWNLYKKSMIQELTDQAEQAAIGEIGAHFSEIEATARIDIKDGYFVVSFHEKDWRLNLQNGDEVFIADTEGNLPNAPTEDQDVSYYGRNVKIQSIAFKTDKGRTFCEIVEETGESFTCHLEDIS